MPASPLNSIEFEPYFALLHDALGDGIDFYVCDTAGETVARDKSGSVTLDMPAIDDAFKCGNLHNRNQLLTTTQAGCTYYLMDICTLSDDIIGFLIATPGQRVESQQVEIGVHTENTLRSIVLCIEKEYRMSQELDAMAQELAGRYEELNLIYEANDEESLVGHEGETLTQLISNYVEYLDVDMVALLFPRQDRIFCTTNKKDPVLEPYDVVSKICEKYLPHAEQDGKCLLINDFTDQKRDFYSLDIPYKIIACPVVNSLGTIDGILICLNHIHRSDFFNSDRNLLTVIARKISKILQTNYDGLTGLINQHAFASIIQDSIATAHNDGRFHCLLNVDLDQLKIINETLGREAGDYTIRRTGELLQQKLRNTDTVSYMGEGRYGILLEQCSLKKGMHVAETLRSLIEHSGITWKSKPAEITITIGVSIIEPQTKSMEQVFEAAELARDTAKELGRNRIHLFRQNDKDLAARKGQMQWVTRIQKALRNNLFRLYCQTIRPVKPCNEAYHFEVLLRLVDRDGSIVMPESFITPAERFNLMPIIDRWVIETTFAMLSSAGLARRRGEGLASINLSGQSLTDEDLADYICEKLDKYRIAADCICFEITETAAIGNIKSAHRIITRMKTRGCHFSLDDFGTGLSSFSYLRELPVDFLKIDGSFVRTILKDRIAHAMVSSINQIGHVMNLKTIAEFVESDELATQLEHLDIDYLQGYAIAKPSPLENYLSGLQRPRTASAG
jgi:diguanylate cyclase (GGDEF)-like protein